MDGGILMSNDVELLRRVYALFNGRAIGSVKSASRSDRERANQRVDFNLSPRPPGVIECGIVRPAKTVMADFLVDAEALLAARLERVSPDDISRQGQPNLLHPQHGAYHHG
jgi:hypothetical protein